METMNLRLQPGIEVVLEVPAVLGFRTVLLQCTGVTGSASLDTVDASLRIYRAQLEVLTGWTFPYIEMLVYLNPVA